MYESGARFCENRNSGDQRPLTGCRVSNYNEHRRTPAAPPHSLPLGHMEPIG